MGGGVGAAGSVSTGAMGSGSIWGGAAGGVGSGSAAVMVPLRAFSGLVTSGRRYFCMSSSISASDSDVPKVRRVAGWVQRNDSRTQM